MHIYSKRASLQELGGEIFKLVSYGATPEQWAEWLRVPLEHAVARGNLDLVNALLQAGADGRAGWRGCRGRTLLDAAAVGGNPDVVTTLLRAGAQPDVNVVSMSPKRSALFAATMCGHEEVAKRLFLAGADVNFQDPLRHCTVLHEAAGGGHEQLVNDLLVAGADPTRAMIDNASTSLHRASVVGHVGIVSALLLRGANKDALDHVGATPLMWAAWWGHVAAVDTLVSAGADFNIRDDNHGAALDYAAIKGRVPVIKAILKYGAEVNSRDPDGHSALHKAAASNQADAVDALVEAGANIELKTNAHRTPLNTAACVGQRKSMLALLKQGASVMVRSYHGATVLHHACWIKPSGLEVVVDILLRWGADEVAANSSGDTPLGYLNLEAPSAGQGRCSQEEIERVRLLLTRAPADRTWRRRGWVVMLRSRASKVWLASHGIGSGGSNVAVARNQQGECRKAARIGVTAPAGVQLGGRRQRSSSGGNGSVVGGLLRIGGGGGAAVNDVGLSGVVALLLGLELEGVFRTVVSFL